MDIDLRKTRNDKPMSLIIHLWCHSVLHATLFFSIIVQSSNAKPPETWYGQTLGRISALEQKHMELKKIHKSYMKLRTQVTGLKNSEELMRNLIKTDEVQEDQTAQAIKEKGKLLQTEEKLLEDALMAVGDRENSLVKEIKIHEEDHKKNKQNVTELSQTIKNDGVTITSMAQAIASLQAEVKVAGQKAKDLEDKLSSLIVNALHKADMQDEAIRPILKEFRNSQATLAEAFRIATKKTLKLEPLIHALERKFDLKVETMEEIGKQISNLNKQVVYIKNRMDVDNKEMLEFLAPIAKDNVEMHEWATSLRKEIAGVRKQAYSKDADVLAEKKAKNALNKELSQLRSSRQIMLEKTLIVDKGIGSVREALHQRAIDGPDNRMMSHMLLRQMAVLRSLKNLRTNQGHISDSMNAYRASVLKTDRLLLDRDQRRIREEVELGRLKAKLAKVYIKMKLMADRIPMTVMKAIENNVKRNLVRINHMQHQQVDIRKNLDHWAHKVFLIRANMKQSLLHEKADKAVLDSLSVRVARLNNRFNKISKTPPGSVPALTRLGDMLEVERSLSGVANAYNAHLIYPLNELRIARMWDRQQAARNIQNNLAAITGKKRRK